MPDVLPGTSSKPTCVQAVEQIGSCVSGDETIQICLVRKLQLISCLSSILNQIICEKLSGLTI